MARFEDILPALREGKKARREAWLKDEFIYMENGHVCRWHGGTFGDLYEQINEDDWEIIEEKPKLKKVVFKKWLLSIDSVRKQSVWMPETCPAGSHFIPLYDESGNQCTKTEWIEAGEKI